MKTKSLYRPKPIPPFKTLDEEADFWDTHDTSLLGKVPLMKLPLLESEKEDVMTVRLQRSVKERLSRFARAKGINSSTLARMWIIEKLNALA
ncbi:MAG: hypothetical protein UV63_C0036G0008 [Microgenomates group bacterium GW2011_GWC1_43_11]|nr:MAG: hypothetical protein UV63_C0036G0008 [Microgenomates group bacterium GW2011_GWC1_43_11]